MYTFDLGRYRLIRKPGAPLIPYFQQRLIVRVREDKREIVTKRLSRRRRRIAIRAGVSLESRSGIDAFDHNAPVCRCEAAALFDWIINQPVLDLARRVQWHTPRTRLLDVMWLSLWQIERWMHIALVLQLFLYPISHSAAWTLISLSCS